MALPSANSSEIGSQCDGAPPTLSNSESQTQRIDIDELYRVKLNAQTLQKYTGALRFVIEYY
jgi:hypothetical protein